MKTCKINHQILQARPSQQPHKFEFSRLWHWYKAQLVCTLSLPSFLCCRVLCVLTAQARLPPKARHSLHPTQLPVGFQTGAPPWSSAHYQAAQPWSQSLGFSTSVWGRGRWSMCASSHLATELTPLLSSWAQQQQSVPWPWRAACVLITGVVWPC